MTTSTTICLSCELDLDHCHSPILEHADGTATCVDGCGRPRSAHDESIDCADLGPPGCCTLPDVEELLGTPGGEIRSGTYRAPTAA